MHIVFIANIISVLTLGTQVMAYGKCRDSSATKTDVGFGAIYDATAAHWVGKIYPNDYADQAAVHESISGMYNTMLECTDACWYTPDSLKCKAVTWDQSSKLCRMFYGDGIMTGLKSASKGSGVAYRGAACGTGGWVEGQPNMPCCYIWMPK